ncbi:MAG: hypothetical protein ABIL92_02970 [candidate division WOR-3 bacterium]
MKFLYIFVFLTYDYAHTNSPLFNYLERSYGIVDSLQLLEGDFVKFTKSKSGEDLLIDSIIEYGQYKRSALENALSFGFYNVLAETVGVSQKGVQTSGLIPTIQIPIYIPPTLSFFGPGEARLDFNGSQSVSLRFEKNVNYDPLSYVGGRYSYFNPQLEQQLRLNLQGTVGTKLKILIDHDSERQDETKNRVVVRFEGEEDDVVRLLEFGDTRVSLPSTRFASFPGQSKEGLFGFNSQFQLGPLKLQAIATREKGESQSTSLSRGAVQDSLILYSRDFEKFRFFYIPEAESIVSINVLVDEQRGIQPGVTIRGFAYYYGYNQDSGVFSPDTALKELGNFKVLVEGKDYYFYPKSKILELFRGAGENHVIAVSYRTASGREVGMLNQDTVPYFDSLRLVKPSSFPLYLDSLFTKRDSLKAVLWNSMLTNIYDLRATYLTLDNIDIQIGRDSSGVLIWGEGGRSFLNILGLDNNNDGKVDLVRYENGVAYDILDLNKGLLIFPMPRPFIFDSLSVKDSIIYKKTRLLYSEGTTYVIKVLKRQVAQTIYLNQMNIIEGSDVVKYNGRILSRGTDYEIDYMSGVITIKNEMVLRDPDARIDVSFDYAPLFSLKDKALWGVRFDIPIVSSLRFGGSFMGRSESSPQKRPTLGSEPTRSLVGEVDLNLDEKIPFLTDLFNSISLNKSNIPTTLRLQAELARSFPDPNTRYFAYLDDMENSKDEMYLSFSIYDWKRSSIPLAQNNVEKDTFYLGSKIVWVGVYDLYRKGQIFSNLPDEEKNYPHLVFYLELYPKAPGIPSFLGISSVLSYMGQDFTNYEYLNVIIKGRKGKMYIDVGPDISENGVWRDRAGRIKSYDPYVISSEDKNGNGVLDEGEDTGLDGIQGADSLWNLNSLDDGNDDYYYPRTGERNYSRVNGTEGNGRLDTEELIIDGKLSLENNYYEMVIDLENPDPGIFVGENPYGFRTFLIPIKDTTYVKKFGNPNWGYVRFVRIWFDQITEPETLVIAQVKFQGNKYVKTPVMTSDSLHPVFTDEFVGVRSVGNMDDPDYTSPPGIELERDLITGRLEQENSLAIKYENIRQFHYAMVTQRRVQTQDFMNYRDIRFFIRIRPGTPPPYPTVFIRLGDSLNYYEYRFKVRDSNWQEIVIPIDSLTQIKKLLRDSLITPGPHIIGNVAIKGNPSFTQVRMISFGILNDESEPISGEVWIDELRLGNPRRDRATAYQVNIDFRWTSFLSINLTASRLQSNFRSLQGEGRKSDDRNFVLSLGGDFGSILPRSWGLRLSGNYILNEMQSLPLYGAYSDLILKPEQQLQQRSVVKSRRASFSFSKSPGSRNFFIKYFIEPFSVSGYQNRDFSTGPRSNRFYLGRNLSFSHGIKFPLSFKVIGTNLSPLPDYRFTGSLSEAKTYSKDIISNIELKDSIKSFDQNHSFTYNPFPYLNSSLSLGRTYDLWRKMETAYNEVFSSGLRFSLFKLIDPVSLNFSTSYRENRDVAMLSVDSNAVRNISSSANGSSSFTINYSQAILKVLSVFPPKDPADSTGKQNPAKEKFKRFFSSFQPLTVTYSITDNYGLYRVNKRPSWEFRYGFDRNAVIDSGSIERFSNTFTRQYTFRTGLNLFGVSISVNGSFGNTVNKVYISKRYSKNATWPSITLSNFNIRNKFLSKVFNNLNAGFSYTRTVQQSGTFGNLPDNITTTVTLMPSMNFALRKGIGGRLDYSYTSSDNRDLRFGERIQKNEEHRINLSPSYTISPGMAIRIPGSEKSFKLKSSLQLSSNLQWSRGMQKSVSGGKEMKIRDNTNYNISVSGNYSITRDISASLGFGYRRFVDNLSKRYNSSTNFALNVNFNF